MWGFVHCVGFFGLGSVGSLSHSLFHDWRYFQYSSHVKQEVAEVKARERANLVANSATRVKTPNAIRQTDAETETETDKASESASEPTNRESAIVHFNDKTICREATATGQSQAVSALRLMLKTVKQGNFLHHPSAVESAIGIGVAKVLPSGTEDLSFDTTAAKVRPFFSLDLS